jgi:hypothetical protein
MESQYDGVKRSLQGLTSDIGSTLVEPPGLADVDARGRALALAASSSESGPHVIVEKTLVYNAAPGSSLGAEEDLFSAASRSRMVGW